MILTVGSILPSCCRVIFFYWPPSKTLSSGSCTIWCSHMFLMCNYLSKQPSLTPILPVCQLFLHVFSDLFPGFTSACVDLFRWKELPSLYDYIFCYRFSGSCLPMAALSPPVITPERNIFWDLNKMSVFASCSLMGSWLPFGSQPFPVYLTSLLPHH